MIEKKGTFYAGVFVFIIPFLGFPTMWKMVLVGIAGFILIVMSVRVPSPRRLVKNKIKREVVSEAPVLELKENIVQEPQPIELEKTPIVPKIEIVVPKKTRRTSTKSSASKKINIQE